VNASPSAGTITGSSAVCAGSTITLSNTTTGGTWSSSNTAIATVGSTGIVTGVASGTVTISYTVTNSCGTATAIKVITVNALSGGIPTSGLIAWYPFNGNANDESGNGNNGSNYGATLTADRFGNANKAYSFNGSTDYISIPLSIPAVTEAFDGFTISGWINLNTLGSNSEFVNCHDVNAMGYSMTYAPANGWGACNYNWNVPMSACMNQPAVISASVWQYVVYSTNNLTNKSYM
jgi:hypothetical protein